ncbi:50S ribosomal protein L10 [Solidesulfovibrio carbinoliphilus subsp. oakridgensis]|uniref:Large ribosomal subunit protein uL10 n=2 Tax=Desulfovibrionaceae TaxID=194924 RepID=G7QD03_9BACT|nr:50S ribosomal protein L10 [Solidesulfovibrio carbinoliphilus]EHJ46309.1 50S ribosomal protein L10 [Solidesulfovibrio carbinoliphilus subsp. oakridgensis]
MQRAQKNEIIEKLRAKADRAGIAVVTDFRGMTVEELTELRVKLRAAGIDYQVVKNTLARLAVKGGEHDALKDHLKENNAVAFGYDDPVVAAKVLVEYAKTSKKFSVKLASLSGKIIDAPGVVELSKLPSKPELLAKTLGTMNAVPTNFVGLFANVIRGMLYALSAVKEKKEAA